ncbi:MAG: hypothetical protein A2W90_01025 [Bacteroidetes bacterium GWF2_42_66]|nr:MAG: hypothetical protein A2W92_00445 [Bacteroidetes bacterium GWA2_42_15]OFY00967.1 MAG: hypothetical protein A2W89_14515 [Bacteroidetes bacterium GWE2_42_39]OFY41807.1 MAG: hypothetical protein A2W90_01025 [Bacteroidetes bacterium GWF2_42_66]
MSFFSHGQSVSHSDFVVQPYLQQVTDDSFRVLWETSLPGKGAVQFGVAEFNVLKPKLDQLFQDETSGTFHKIIVDGLKVDGHYFYQALTIGENGDTLKGPVTPIHIPDYTQMPVSFTVVSDTQGNPTVWGKIAELMQRERPSFVIHAGDLVQYGPHKDDWTDEFFKPAAELFRFYPLYPAIGNHEMNHDWFYQYFDLPSPEWFYTLKKGNVLFVFVDTNKDILPGSEQYKKLEKILASSKDLWKIMVHHHPVYTSSENSYGNTWFQKQAHGDPNEMHLKRLYETYGVNLVLFGHVHSYERTWPIANEKVDQENGVTYLNLGGGGGRLDKAGANKTWYAARTRSCHHFLNVSIADNTLYASTIDTAGVTFDSCTIDRKNAGRPNAPYMGNSKQYFIGSTTAFIQNESQHGTIYYSMNGKDYKKGKGNELKIPVNATSEISAYIENTGQKSRIATKNFEKLEILPSVKNTEAGVKATYYEGNWIALPDFDKIEPVKTFNLDSVSLQNIQPRVQDHFAVRFTGNFSVPETDVYRFLLESFDGSKLFIDGQEVISNDGIHYEISKENFVALEKGLHSFEIQYFDFLRRETLNIWTGTEPEKMKWFNEFIVRK